MSIPNNSYDYRSGRSRSRTRMSTYTICGQEGFPLHGFNRKDFEQERPCLRGSAFEHGTGGTGTGQWISSAEPNPTGFAA